MMRQRRDACEKKEHELGGESAELKIAKQRTAQAGKSSIKSKQEVEDHEDTFLFSR